jgi:ketosteroid isomerase-like protein
VVEHGVADEMNVIAEQIRSAFAARELGVFGALLADDARWGDDCRSRRDVVATFERLLGDGVTGDVAETATGRGGVVCRLDVHWPAGSDSNRRATVFQAYFVRDGRIVEIRGYDDRESALEAIRD